MLELLGRPRCRKAQASTAQSELIHGLEDRRHFPRHPRGEAHLVSPTHREVEDSMTSGVGARQEGGPVGESGWWLHRLERGKDATGHDGVQVREAARPELFHQL